MHFIKNFFTVPSKEREAVLVLSGLFVLFFVIIPYIIRITSPQFVLEYELIETAEEPETSGASAQLEIYDSFDPNTISRQELIDMGIGGRLATTWIRFRERVSPFREKQDLLRIYGLDTVLYVQLEPFIEIDSRQSGRASKSEKKPEVATPADRFHFDPNTLPVDSLLLLGFPSRVATTVENFRTRGGKFRQKEDLLKIFTMPEALYYELEPWIKIQETPEIERPQAQTTSNTAYKPATLQMLDLNTATAQDLTQFRGIGQVLSTRIVEHRNLMGGYYAIDQLHEVWGLQDSVIEIMKPYLTLNEKMLSKININSASLEELSKHPYIGWDAARNIVNYRTQNGSFAELDHILRIYSLNNEWFERAKKYLSVELIPN